MAVKRHIKCDEAGIKKKSSIVFLCKVVILYFQCNLGKILKEICYNKFQSFYYSIFIGKFTSGGIYRA